MPSRPSKAAAGQSEVDPGDGDVGLDLSALAESERTEKHQDVKCMVHSKACSVQDAGALPPMGPSRQ